MAADGAPNPDASGANLIEIFDRQEIDDQRQAGDAPRLTPQAQIVERTELTHPNMQMGNTMDAPSDQNREDGDADVSTPLVKVANSLKSFEIQISPETVREIQLTGTNAFVPVRFDSVIESRTEGETGAKRPIQFKGVAADPGSNDLPDIEAPLSNTDGGAEFFILVTPETVAETLATVTVDTSDDDDAVTLVFEPLDLEAVAPSLSTQAANGL
ncbi:MAG: hypothetical protein HOJ06_07020, partial [Rhodospirillaceae bacterium]|nr:hypothetical protein [Rhodospirillaceae bacterium]